MEVDAVDGVGVDRRVPVGLGDLGGLQVGCRRAQSRTRPVKWTVRCGSAWLASVRVADQPAVGDHVVAVGA